MKKKLNRSVLIFESTRPYNPTSGGSYYSLRPVISAFCDQGWNVEVTSYVDNSLLNFPEYKNINNHILEHFSLRRYIRQINIDVSKKKSMRQRNDFLKKLKSFIDFPLSAFFTAINTIYLISTLLKLKPDVVYCNTGIVNDRSMILASTVLNIKIVCHLRNLPLLSKVDRFLAKRVSAAIFISKTVLDHYIASNIKFESHLVRHNALGINFDSQPYEVGKNVFLSGEDFKIACFMRLIEWKGGSTLLKAFFDYRNKNGKGKLFIYGDGPSRDDLEKETKLLNLEKFVKFHGHTENVIKQINMCSLIIAPSDEPEPLGRTVMESKRLGIPVIASNAGGHKEIINHNFDGLHYEIKSHQSLSLMMLEVFLNFKLREKLVKKGLQQSKSWSVSNYKEAILNFIEKSI